MTVKARFTASGSGYLGWIIQVGDGTIVSTAIGLDQADTILRTQPAVP